MTYDICQCQVTLSDAQAVRDWNGLIKAFLSHGTTAPKHLKAVLTAEPDFAMGHAVRGLFSMMMGRREIIEVGHQANTTAQEKLCLGGANRRETLWCEALDVWVSGSALGAISTLEKALALNPADTFTMKVIHAIRFIVGDSIGMRRSVEAVLQAHDADHALRGYTLGCYAFSLEETGDYDAAERVGLEGLTYAPDDAWGLHAVAHVYDMTHNPAKGISLIDHNTTAWDHCNNFRFHVWWHKALLHLDRGEYADVLHLYDTKVRYEKTDDYRDFSNASSLLTRLELEGVDVGTRWSELADLAESRSEDGCLVFADLHYMLALSGDSRADATSNLIGRVARDAKTQTEAGRLMTIPGMSAATGLAAFGEGRYDDAFHHLLSAQPHFGAMGGSHAQRDVFERVTVDAGIRAGQLDQAEHLVRARNKLRGGHIDTFGETRLQTISNARRVALSVAAQ
jgi:tetratricopeptide (TPR) repeat protein